MEVTPMKDEFDPANYEHSLVVNRIACGDARD